MPLLKLSFLDASGAGVPGLSVQINGAAEALNTNGDGMVQFLLEEQAQYTIRAAGAQVWQGDSAALQRQMSFKQAAAGFALA
jgi:hypothetical protein